REFGLTTGQAESRLKFAVNRDGVRVRSADGAALPSTRTISFPWEKAKYDADDLHAWIGQERERLKRIQLRERIEELERLHCIEALERIEGYRKEDTERSSVDAHQTRAPDRKAAGQALTDLYPGGIPGAAMVPNKNLCTAVRKKLPADRERNISDDTIL